MAVSDKDFPSSVAFDEINDVMQKNEKQRQEIVKEAGTVFAFVLTNSAGKTEAWYLDFAKEGKVGRGKGPDGKPADVTILVSDEDFTRLSKGEAKAQNLFMRGKIRIRGNMMKAIKLDRILSVTREKL